ncbi:hypothetical protein SLE2022_229380 [Rubroshorea leprosula]
MDAESQPQLPPEDILSLTNSLPSTSMSLPCLDSHIDPEFDWIGFLSDSNKFGEQKPIASNFSLPPGNGASDDGAKSKGKSSRVKKVVPPKIAFHTRSADDILDDGYRWRKYGQKSVKNSIHPRSYYRCMHLTCNVKKQIQRLAKDPSIVVTTYEGIHNHPSEKLMESLSPLLKQLQFLSRI